MDIARIASPTLEDYFAAAEVCETRWQYLRPLHTAARFEGFQRMGVELVVARQGARFDAVCFVLPCTFNFHGEAVEWASLFQLAARPDSGNAGAMLLLRIASAYPAVISMGVTEEATRMYQALRWKCFPDVWRGVHPIDLRRMADDYAGRLDAGWQRVGLKAVAGLYNLFCAPLEAAVAAGVPCVKLEPAALEPKAQWIASYVDVLQAGAAPRFVEAGGIGRVLNAYCSGWGSLRAHARVWRELRRRGAKFCELLATTPEAKSRALRLGYYPIRMPAWYQERNGMATKVIEAIRRNELSFLHTDKSI